MLFLVSKGLKRHSRPFKLLSRLTIGIIARDLHNTERFHVPNQVPLNVSHLATFEATIRAKWLLTTKTAGKKKLLIRSFSFNGLFAHLN